MKTEILTIKVTKINEIYCIRLIEDDRIIDERSCESKRKVGPTCRDMIKWYDKLGGCNKMASKSRDRSNKSTNNQDHKFIQHKSK